MRSALQARAWSVGEPENWRDAGWEIPCRHGDSELQLVVAAMTPEGTWYLQIAASYVPGLIGRLRGKKPSATHEAILELSRQAHDILRASGFSGFAWQWDGPPDESSPPEPAPQSPT